MEQNILLKVHSQDGQEEIHQLMFNRLLSVKSQRNTVFQLINKDTLLAPEHVKIEKLGNDLGIYLDTDFKNPNIVIEKYYLHGDENRLVGLQALGDLKAYNTSALYYVVDGEKRQIALNQNITNASSTDQSGEVVVTWIVAGIYLSILAVSLLRINQDSETETNQLVVASNVSISTDGQVITGQVESGTKVVVSVADKEVIVAVGTDGKFSTMLGMALTNGEEIKVVVQDNAGNSSPAVIIYAPIITLLLQDILVDEVVNTDIIANNDGKYSQDIPVEIVEATDVISSEDIVYKQRIYKEAVGDIDETSNNGVYNTLEIPRDAVVVTVDKVAGDDVVETEEAQDGIIITGLYAIKDESVLADTIKVMINLDGQDIEAIVDQDNQSWYLNIANNLANQAIYRNGQHNFTVKITADTIEGDNVVENTVFGSFVVDIIALLDEPLTLTVDAVEAQDDIQVSGKYLVDTNIKPSSVSITITIAQQTFLAILDTDAGSWHVTIDSNDANKGLFENGTYDYRVNISAEDLIGQSYTQIVSSTVTIELATPPTVSTDVNNNEIVDNVDSIKELIDNSGDADFKIDGIDTVHNQAEYKQDGDAYKSSKYYHPTIEQSEIKEVSMPTTDQGEQFILKGSSELNIGHVDKLPISLNDEKIWDSLGKYYHDDNSSIASTAISAVIETENQSQCVGLVFDNRDIARDDNTDYIIDDIVVSNTLIIDLLLMSSAIGENQLHTLNNFEQTRDKIDLAALLKDQSIENNLSEYFIVKTESSSSMINMDRDASAEKYVLTELIVLRNLITTMQELENTTGFII